MFARMSTYKGAPSRINAARHIDETSDRLRAMEGFKAAYILVDRDSGKAITITLWESAEAVQATAKAASPLRDQIAQVLGAAEPPNVEVYEVAGEV